MKVIVDAHFPYRLARFIREKVFEAIHTDDLPLKERTPDHEIRRIAKLEARIVITKDNDFLDTFLVSNDPQNLLLVTTGNIKNPELLQLFEHFWAEIIRLFKIYDFIELNNYGLFVRED